MNLTDDQRARLGTVAMCAFWRMEAVPQGGLTKEEVAVRWQEAASAVVEAVEKEVIERGGMLRVVITD